MPLTTTAFANCSLQTDDAIAKHTIDILMLLGVGESTSVSYLDYFEAEEE
jgi:hypothetical protein